MRPIELVWPGGEHTFDISGIGALEGLQDACDAGPEFILRRIEAGAWRKSDLVDTIRFGLIGGGMDRLSANKLVQDAWDRHPWFHFKMTAVSILGRALLSPADDPVGKDEPVEPTPKAKKTARRTASGSSPRSTD